MASAIQDRYGLELSTASATAAERYADGVDLLLSMNAGAGPCFEQAIAIDDGFALAHATLALTLLAQGKADEARGSIAGAQALSGGISRRERQHIAALAALVAGDGPGALALIREHFSDFPRDMYLLSHAVYLLAYGGGGDWHDAVAGLLSPLAAACGDDWWFMSARGFLYEEQGEFDHARRLGEHSLALYPRNAFAVHTLAHVFYETNEHAGGTAFLHGWLTDYSTSGPYRSHLSWHQALCELAAGRYASVMELYQHQISPQAIQSRTTLFDAASLLWRLQIYGCTKAPLPLEEVRAYAASPAAAPAMPFNAVHAALAFAAAGDEAALAGLIHTLRELAAKGHPVAEAVVLPLVSGIAAFGRGQYDEAIRCLEPEVAGSKAIAIGGSNLQREVLEDTLVQAYLRAGRLEQAEALLAKRLRRRPSARDFLWLGRVEAEQEQVEQAGAHLRQARAGWQTADAGSPELAALAGAEQALA